MAMHEIFALASVHPDLVIDIRMVYIWAEERTSKMLCVEGMYKSLIVLINIYK